MATPTLLVEFGFTKSGNDYVWNDISNYVRNVRINRGTSRELDQYSAGQTTITLSNSDRRFDPTFASSPYFGQIQPAGVIRVTSGGFVIFYGFIDAWTFDFPNQGFDAIATVSAYDGLSILAKQTMAASNPYIQYTGNRIQTVLNKAEVSWNPTLTNLDGGNSTVNGDAIATGANVLSYIQQIAKSEPGDFFVSRDGKATFKDRRWLDNSWNTATTRYNYCMVPNFESGTTFYWTNVAQSNSQSYNGVYSGSTNFNSTILKRTAQYDEGDATKYKSNQDYIVSMYVYAPSAATIYLQASLMSGVSTSVTVNSSTAISGNTWTRISCPVLNSSSAVDGIEIYLENNYGNSNLLYIDAVQIEPVSVLDTYFDGTNTPVNDGTKRYSARWGLTPNKSASQLDTSTLKTNPSPSSTINFSDYSGTDIPFVNATVSYNSENLFNRIDLQKTQSPVYAPKEDTALQATYNIRSYSANDYLNTTDNELQNIAGELLYIYRYPELRVEQMDIAVHALSGADQSTVLAIDFRQPVQITIKPARTGTQMVKKYVVIGINHQIDKNKTHMMSFNVASIANLPFHLNSSMLGVLDTNALSY